MHERNNLYRNIHEITIIKRIPEKSGEINIKRTGSKIKRLCDERRISVKTIQKELYIGSFQSVYAWFSGKTLPSLDNMYRLSRLLGVSVDEMIVDQAEEIWEISFLPDAENADKLRKNCKFSAYYNEFVKLAG